MVPQFESGKLYKFIESGEGLPLENDYKTFYQTLKQNKDTLGKFFFKNKCEITFVPIVSGTLALCLGSDQVEMLSSNMKAFTLHKCYKFLIENQITILLQREKNLYSLVELSQTS